MAKFLAYTNHAQFIPRRIWGLSPSLISSNPFVLLLRFAPNLRDQCFDAFHLIAF